MFIDQDYVIRHWKPFRWGILVGFLLHLGFILLTHTPEASPPIPYFSPYSMLLLLLFLVFSPFAFYLYTLFRNFMAPPYHDDGKWKKP